jgi:hypothetical protein
VGSGQGGLLRKRGCGRIGNQADARQPPSALWRRRVYYVWTECEWPGPGRRERAPACVVRLADGARGGSGGSAPADLLTLNAATPAENEARLAAWLNDIGITADEAQTAPAMPAIPASMTTAS